MTTDNPRELREAAKTIKRSSDAYRACDDGEHTLMACTIRTMDVVADYVLATVRDDDGEEQGDVTANGATQSHAIQVNCAGVFAVRYRPDGEVDTVVVMKLGRPTRGQFRDLCRGLGIEVPDVSPAPTDG
jgi:hypothetical protein